MLLIRAQGAPTALEHVMMHGKVQSRKSPGSGVETTDTAVRALLEMGLCWGFCPITGPFCATRIPALHTELLGHETGHMELAEV